MILTLDVETTFDVDEENKITSSPFNDNTLVSVGYKVNDNPDSVAFSIFPTHIDDVIKVANQKLTMPPKTTWFDPKPLDGLVVYEFKQ